MNEMKRIKEIESILSNALNEVQRNTIGLFKPKYSNQLELVISDRDGYLITISPLSLGGFNTNHIDSSQGVYKKFPDNKNMLDFKYENPEFSEFVKSFEK